MMDQPDLFTTLTRPRRESTRDELLAEGRRLRDRGIHASDENASEAWKLVVDVAIAEVADEAAGLAGEGTFTADDVWDRLGEWSVPHPSTLGFDARAFGARMVAAVRRGVAVPLRCDHGFEAFVQSRRPETHASLTRVYRPGSS